MIDNSKRDFGLLDYFKIQEPQNHLELLALAGNESISTQDLIHFGLAEARAERSGEEDRGCLALLILQQRVTREVFEVVKDLLQNPDPAARQLGAMILREFPGRDREKPFKDESLHFLEKLVSHETDEEVLKWGVSAIGWQTDIKAVPLLLRFVDHPSDGVRFMVANNLITNCDPKNPFPTEIAAAYRKLCFDKDADVRWYSFANFSSIAEDDDWTFPDESQKQAFLELLELGKADEDPGVREQIENAITFLKTKTEKQRQDNGEPI